VRDTVDEIRRSVYWVDDPQMFRHVVLARNIFLAQERVIGMRLREECGDGALRLVVCVGYGIPLSVDVFAGNVIGGDVAKMALIHLPTDSSGANRIGQEKA